MYHIMHKNDIIAISDKEQITDIVRPELCPAVIFKGASLEGWIKSRSIDVHRSHSRQLYRVLRIRTENITDEIADLINRGHGVSITDNWWIKEESEQIDYSSLRTYNEEIADIAFYGSHPSKSFFAKGYSELGTLGSYEKAWRFIDGSWYMLKNGNKAELISEYYAYCFLKALNVPVAEYKVQRKPSETGLTDEWIVSKDYSENAKYDFEPFFNYFGDNEDYDYIIGKMEKQFPSLIKPYVMMCFIDALLLNTDRHNHNAGFLRDSENGRILGMSPLYDFNQSLASRRLPAFQGEMMKYFAANKACMKIIKSIIPKKEEIQRAVKTASESSRNAFPDDNFKYSLFEDYILAAFSYLEKEIERQKGIGYDD